MSRVIVKNLPIFVTQQDLKEHFNKGSTVTDCKLVQTKDGRSRKFGFVGFKTDKDAQNAIQYFDKTYFHTCRISVEEALAIGSDNLSRPWSKYSEGSSRYQLIQRKEDTSTLIEKKSEFLRDVLGKEEKDAKLEEFLQVMRPHGSTTKTWGNDDIIDSGLILKPKINTETHNEDNYQDLGIEEIMDIKNVDENDSSKQKALDDTVSDLEYLRSKMKPNKDEGTQNIHPSRLAHLDERCNTAENDDIKRENLTIVEASESKLEQVASEDIIADTGRLMVRNLAYSCTQTEVEDLFSPFGLLAEVHIPISRETKQSKGYAFVLFVMPENALKAYTTLDKSIFQGRILEIVAAKEKPKSYDELQTGPHSLTFKAKRERERKSTASNDFNWNSLFMNVKYDIYF